MITQAFIPKLYIPGGQKMLLEYDKQGGIVTGSDFGVQAYGSFVPRARTPILTIAPRFEYDRIKTTMPIGGGGGGGGGGGPPPRFPTKLVIFATTDDMRNPTFTFTAGALRKLSVTDPQASTDGTQFTSMAIYAAPKKESTVTVVVTATDADGLTVSQSVSVNFTIDG